MSQGNVGRPPQFGQRPTPRVPSAPGPGVHAGPPPGPNTGTNTGPVVFGSPRTGSVTNPGAVSAPATQAARINVPQPGNPATTSAPAHPSAPVTPATRWAQLTYASFDRADGSPGGWQEKDILGDPTDEERRTLRRYVVSQFSYHGALPKFPTPEQVAALPVRLSYHAPDTNRPGVYAYAANAGVDSTGRPGNVFSHILMDRDPDAIHPIDMWRSPSFARPTSVDEILKTNISESPQRGPLGHVRTVASVLQTPGYVEPILALADALMNAQDKRVVVLVSDRQDWSATVITAVQYLMSPSLSRHMSWSLYERARDINTGMHIVAVPECDREAVQHMDNAYVICDGDTPRIEGEQHVLTQGRPIPVTPFSTLIRACVAQPEELAAKLQALAGMDDWAPVEPGERVQPVWSLAALIVKEPGALPDAATDLAFAQASVDFPASARNIEELFSHISQDVSAQVLDHPEPWTAVAGYSQTEKLPERLVGQRAALLATLTDRIGLPDLSLVVPDSSLARDAEVVDRTVDRLTKDCEHPSDASLALAELVCVLGIADENPAVSELLTRLIQNLPHVDTGYSGYVELDSRVTDTFAKALLEREGSVASTPATTSAVPPRPQAPPPAGNPTGAVPERPAGPPPVPAPTAPPQGTAPQWPPREAPTSRWAPGGRATGPATNATAGQAAQPRAISQPLARALTRDGLPTSVYSRVGGGAFTPLVAQLVVLSLDNDPQLGLPLAKYVRTLPADPKPAWALEAILKLPVGIVTECVRTVPQIFDTDAILSVINSHEWSTDLQNLCEDLATGAAGSRRTAYARILLDAYSMPYGVPAEVLAYVTQNLGDWKTHHGHALSSYLYAYQLASTLYPDAYAMGAPHPQSVNADDIIGSAVGPDRVRRILMSAHPDIAAEDLVMFAAAGKSAVDAFPAQTVRVLELEHNGTRIITGVCAPIVHEADPDAVLERIKDRVADRGGTVRLGRSTEIKNTVKSLSRQEDTR